MATHQEALEIAQPEVLWAGIAEMPETHLAINTETLNPAAIETRHPAATETLHPEATETLHPAAT